MQHYSYLILLAGCLGFTLLASWWMGVWTVFGKRLLFLLGILGVLLGLFGTWDYFAIMRGHWYFNPLYIVGHQWLNVPIEEWLFFIIIPFFSISMWEMLVVWRKES